MPRRSALTAVLVGLAVAIGSDADHALVLTLRGDTTFGRIVCDAVDVNGNGCSDTAFSEPSYGSERRGR